MKRTETEVDATLARLSVEAKRAALLEKNAEKGPWDHLGVRELLVLLLEEVGEVARAYNHNEGFESFVAEIGDAVWVLGMLRDAASQSMELSGSPTKQAFEGYLRRMKAIDATLWRMEEDLEAAEHQGCALELKLLDAHQRCGACGYEAQLHRNWKGSRA